jgi:hypothetical protein
MNDPVSCPKGHTFYRHYVSKHLDAQASGFRTCPTCRTPLSEDRLVPRRLIGTLIEELEVRCFSLQIAHRDGNRGLFPNGLICDWSVMLKDVEKHNNQCQFTNTTCPHSGCNEIFVRRNLPEHMKTCEYRPTSMSAYSKQQQQRQICISPMAISLENSRDSHSPLSLRMVIFTRHSNKQCYFD